MRRKARASWRTAVLHRGRGTRLRRRRRPRGGRQVVGSEPTGWPDGRAPRNQGRCRGWWQPRDGTAARDGLVAGSAASLTGPVGRVGAWARTAAPADLRPRRGDDRRLGRESRHRPAPADRRACGQTGRAQRIIATGGRAPGSHVPRGLSPMLRLSPRRSRGAPGADRVHARRLVRTAAGTWTASGMRASTGGGSSVSGPVAVREESTAARDRQRGPRRRSDGCGQRSGLPAGERAVVNADPGCGRRRSTRRSGTRARRRRASEPAQESGAYLVDARQGLQPDREAAGRGRDAARTALTDECLQAWAAWAKTARGGRKPDASCCCPCEEVWRARRTM